MTIEIRQLRVISEVKTQSAERNAQAELRASVDVAALERAILAKCQRMLSDMLRESQHQRQER